MSEEPILVRQAEPADSDAIAGLFRRAYQQTAHPCIRPDYVAASFARGATWWVCALPEAVVACAGLVSQGWNAMYEMGRSVTLPDYQQQGLGRLLWSHCLRWATERGEHDLLFGKARSPAICRMCEPVGSPLLLFGHDGGANISNGIRELHAVGLIHTLRPCRRAEPRFGPGMLPLFKERIAQLDFQDVMALPPPELLVGPPGEYRYQTPRGTGLRYSRRETALGWSVLVTEVTGPATELGPLFARFLADHVAIRHLGCYVLWDKFELVAQLGALGFEATAYLPGWYLRAGLRHDCLQLSWLAPGGTVRDNGLWPLVRPLQEALAGLTCPSAPSAAGAVQPVAG